MTRKAFIWLAFLLVCDSAPLLRAQSNFLLNPLVAAPFLTNALGAIATNWTGFVSSANLACSENTQNVYSGANCQQVSVANFKSNSMAMFYDVFTYQPGSVYQASIWLRASSNVPVQFELRGSNTVQRGFQAAASHILTLGTNWTQVTINGGWQNGSFAEFAINFMTNGTYWINDGSLIDVTSNYLYAPFMNTTSAIPQTLFGMHINEFTAPDNWPPLQQGIVRFWDIGIHWNQVETNTNTYTFNIFDSCTNTVRMNNPGVKVIYTLGQTPAWAALTTNTPTAKNGPGASSPPSDMTYWSNYVQTVATRYKGFIQYYEIWNESDSPSYYTGSIADMVTMAQIAHEVLTNVDPTIKILGPNITLGGLGFLEQYIQAGGPLPDIVTFHNYMASVPEYSLGEVAGLRDMLSRYPGWSALPIWCTEGAALTNSDAGDDPGIVSRAYLFWWTQNIQNWCWYTWDKGGEAGYVPLCINPPTEDPAAGGIAYSNTADWLAGAQMANLAVDTNGSWTVALERLGSTTAHVVWNPTNTVNYSIPVNWNAYQMRDTSNNITSLIGVSNTTIGVCPVILDSIPSLLASNSTNSQLSLLWPAPATGFNLYATTNLVTPAWLKVTNTVTSTNGNLQVILPAVRAMQFFRLSTQ